MSLRSSKPSVLACCSAVEPRPWNDRTTGSGVVPSHPAGRRTSVWRGLPATVRSMRVRPGSVETVHFGVVVVVVFGVSAVSSPLEQAASTPARTTRAKIRRIRDPRAQ